MTRHLRIAVLVVSVLCAGQVLGGEPWYCEPPQTGFLQRVHPVGGWDPYGGGLLHWWNPYCLPPCGGPDDYCRKKLPILCWPTYPPYYRWVPGEMPQSNCHGTCDNP